MSDTQFEKTAEQAAAFQKIWMESLSRIMQAACTISPNSPPPEILRHIRTGIFQALGQSWDDFMRSPQFLDGMRQWMESAVSFRKMTNDFMARVRNDLQAPSRDDIDTVMLTVRHMEKRLLDRVEELSAQVAELNQRLAAKPAQAATNTSARKRPSRKGAKASGSRTAKEETP